MSGSALLGRFKSFLHLFADLNEFIEAMPTYTKRDGAAIIYVFNSLFDISWKMIGELVSLTFAEISDLRLLA